MENTNMKKNNDIITEPMYSAYKLAFSALLGFLKTNLEDVSNNIKNQDDLDKAVKKYENYYRDITLLNNKIKEHYSGQVQAYDHLDLNIIGVMSELFKKHIDLMNRLSGRILGCELDTTSYFEDYDDALQEHGRQFSSLEYLVRSFYSVDA